MKLTSTILAFILCITATAFAQDAYITVHFIYGSKPEKRYRDVEPEWFGGINGGHVGIEIHKDSVLNFNPQGSFHVVAKKELHSRFAIHTVNQFWGLMGGNGDDMKKMSIVIPITTPQVKTLDSLSAIYLSETPYDYAFMGMRCASAAYDVLSKIGVVTEHAEKKTAVKIFYPKLLRQYLLKRADDNHWTVIRHEGTKRRKWERD